MWYGLKKIKEWIFIWFFGLCEFRKDCKLYNRDCWNILYQCDERRNKIIKRRNDKNKF